MGPRSRAVARPVLLGAALLSTGCAGLFSRFDVAPSGLPRAEDELRRRLAEGEMDAALAAVGPDGEAEPGDELLALMYRGLVSHHAGRFEESSALLVRAEALAEDRYTKSVSRALLSLVAGDRVIAYDPEPTERLFLHYYDALNWLRLGDREEAAVAARRLSHLLDLYAERPADARELQLRAFLRLFAGGVFEAAGEEDDAAVAYARGAAAGAELPPGDVVTAGTTRVATGDPEGAPGTGAKEETGADPGAPTGELLLVVESGFVAHRVERSLHLLLWPHELDAFAGGDPARRLGASTCLARLLLGAEASDGAGPPVDVPAALAAAGPLDPSTRERCVPLPAAGAPPVRRAAARSGRGDDGDSDGISGDRAGVPHLVRIAWPAFRRDGEVDPPIRVGAPGGVAHAVPLMASLSDAVVAEFEAGSATRFVTTLARTALKYGLARALEEETREEDETLGDVVGIVADAGAALLERADIRSWHLLPDRVSAVRLRLPAGVHELSLVLGGAGGRRVGTEAVTVRAGVLDVVALRVWPDGAPVGRTARPR